jgi:hypothetical protein
MATVKIPPGQKLLCPECVARVKAFVEGEETPRASQKGDLDGYRRALRKESRETIEAELRAALAEPVPDGYKIALLRQKAKRN